MLIYKNVRDRKNDKYFLIEDGCDLSNLICIAFLGKIKLNKTTTLLSTVVLEATVKKKNKTNKHKQPSKNNKPNQTRQILKSNYF